MPFGKLEWSPASLKPQTACGYTLKWCIVHFANKETCTGITEQSNNSSRSNRSDYTEIHIYTICIVKIDCW